MRKFLLPLIVVSSLFANSLDEIRTTKVIRIGVRDNNQAPLIINNNGHYSGFEVDLITRVVEEIFKNENIKIEFVPEGPKDKIPNLEKNKVDVVMGISKSSEREKKVDFTMPYLTSTISVISRKGEIKDKKDLNNKTFIFRDGTSVAKYFNKSNYKDNKFLICPKISNCIELLKNKEGDAYIDINFLVAQSTLLDSTIERPIKNLGDFSYTCMAVSKNNKSLANAINKALIALSKEGFFKKEYKSTFLPFYKDSLDKKYILIEDLYKSMF